MRLKASLVIFIVFYTVFSVSIYCEEVEQDEDQVYKMQEYQTNYFISGKPNSKIQFSFKFQLFKHIPIMLGYTQAMFWELGKKASNPFSEINYRPELFYHYDTQNSIFDSMDFGYTHFSNGKDGLDSRAVDSIHTVFYLDKKDYSLRPHLELELRYFVNEDVTNRDIKDYYGPIDIKLNFDELGYKLLKAERLYLEYYNGGKFAEDFSKSSFRVSTRFKIWRTVTSPRIFIQYFNGYGEKLANYNLREETYRIGLSLGGI